MAKYMKKCDKRVELRLSEDMYSSLSFLAEKCGMSLSMYIRKILLKVVIKYGNSQRDLNDKL